MSTAAATFAGVYPPVFPPGLGDVEAELFRLDFLVETAASPVRVLTMYSIRAL